MPSDRMNEALDRLETGPLSMSALQASMDTLEAKLMEAEIECVRLEHLFGRVDDPAERAGGGESARQSVAALKDRIAKLKSWMGQVLTATAAVERKVGELRSRFPNGRA